MTPIYRSNFLGKNWRTPGEILHELITTTAWEVRTEARSECFMAIDQRSYTYGTGKGVRTYHSIPLSPIVRALMDMVNEGIGLSFNGCFVNRYDNKHQQLGWHADDSPEHDPKHPIVVMSFGQAREFWWRKKGEKGVVPASQRRLLENGSIIIMPGGFQDDHEHRIPKGDHEMEIRISLTFRSFLSTLEIGDGTTTGGQ